MFAIISTFNYIIHIESVVDPSALKCAYIPPTTINTEAPLNTGPHKFHYPQSSCDYSDGEVGLKDPTREREGW